MTALTLSPASVGTLSLTAPSVLDMGVRHVHPSGSDGNDGRAWTSAYATIQKAIDDLLGSSIGGGVILLGPGEHDGTTALDFSALKGTNKSLEIAGMGGGDVTGAHGFDGVTRILNSSGGTYIGVYGNLATNKPVVGLTLRDFVIENTANIGSAYTVDLDYCVGTTNLHNVFVYGNGKTGNGIAFRNIAIGHSHWSNVRCREFQTGTGFRISCETTANATAINSGNVVFDGLEAFNCLTSYDLLADGNLMNSHVFNAPKAVCNTDIVGSIAYRIRNGASGQSACHVFNSPHSERCNTGFSCEGGTLGVVVNGGIVAYLAGTPDAGSTAIKCKDSSRGNIFNSVLVEGMAYGAQFLDTSQGNYASLLDSASSPITTALFNDAVGKSRVESLGTNTALASTWIGMLLTLARTGTNPVLNVRETVDTAARLAALASGKLQWGDGTNVADVFLSRFAAGTLELDGLLRVTPASGGAGALQAILAADVHSRFAMDGNGLMTWGDGTNATDVDLFRDVANRLKTDDQLAAADGLTTKFLSGAGKTTVVDGDFTATPGDGTMAIHRDTTAAKTYISVRSNGAWVVMAGPL